MSSWTALAPAKLNLALHITGKRSDGYHTLESLVAFVDIGDTVSIFPADTLALEVTGPFASEAGDVQQNHVWKAAKLVQEKLGISKGARIVLDKQLPVGAGLGGGSTDAAAASKLLLKYWGHIVPEATLAQWLLALGADMPMCVAARPLIAKGIGEEIDILPSFPAMQVLLCWPCTKLDTRRVYEAYRDEGYVPPFTPDYSSAKALFASLDSSRNMLQRAAIACIAEVGEALLVMNTLAECPFVRMSGSGACCVAYFDNAEDADASAAYIGRRYPHWWIKRASVSAV